MDVISVRVFVYLCYSPNHYYIMQLTHIAIWTNELECAREFYVNYSDLDGNIVEIIA